MRCCCLIAVLIVASPAIYGADKQEVAAHVFSFAATVGDIAAGVIAQGGRR